MLFRYICVCIFFVFNVLGKQLEIQTLSKNVVLINGKNGRILYQKNPYEKIYPASLTKIATLLFLLDKKKDRLIDKIKISKKTIFSVDSQEKDKYPPYILEKDGTNLDLKEGEIISSSDLLYALMLISGNDCANVLAKSVCGSIFNFMKELNEYLKTLELKDTSFFNPHGLHYKNHITTAYEIALIAKKALKIEKFKNIVKTPYYVISKTNKHPKRKIVQYNELLNKQKRFFYPPAIGIKTGYHSKAKFNLVAAAEKENRLLIAVLMSADHSDDRYIDAINLFEKAFSEKKIDKKIFKKDSVFSLKIKGTKNLLKAYLKDDVIFSCFPSEEQKIKSYIRWEKTILPIEKDELVAHLYIIPIDKKEFICYPLYSKEKMESSFWSKLFFLKKIIKKFNKFF
ncbi:MAG: hypothetical protein AMS24_04045 [Chlamydiae bacterium SM23_39]|nr:MAG: hypothetical protein AMS24_04045 [Chlamydiae bacterium SM23_39]